MWGEEDSGENEVNGPTFEDLAIDPDLDDVERVVRYSIGSVELQRLVHVMMLADTARVAGFDVAQRRLFPLVETVSRDQEPVVRQNLASQLASLCEFCHVQGSEEAYNTMIRVLLPVFNRLVSDREQDVREAASVALIQVADFVREDDLMEHVLSIVLELAHDEANDNLRITSAGLLNGLSPRFGAALCQQFCVPEMISLSQDPSFKVRRAVAYCMDKILRVADNCRDRLLPSFVRLCNDQIWGVRKACGDSLALVAESVDEAVRVEQLLPLADALSADKSKWVRGALSQRLGRFIASLPHDKVPEDLVQRFVDMTKIDSGDACWINKGAEKSTTPSARRSSGVPATLRAAQDGLGAGQPPMDFASNIMYCCAFNFPAVVLARPQSWELVLFPAFQRLVHCDHANVRKTVAHALHELAQVLGPDTAEKALVPVLRYFLYDVAEVRFGVVLSLARFFSALSPAAREAHLGLLSNIAIASGVPADALARNLSPPVAAEGAPHGAGAPASASEGGAHAASLAASGSSAGSLFSMEAAFDAEPASKWRFRRAIASQLDQFATLLSVPRTVSVIVPLALVLMRDDVEAVRRACNVVVGPCLKRLRLAEENNKYQAFQDAILAFAASRVYHERQHFVSMCAHLHADPEFASELAPSLLDALFRLADDPVPNVRIVLAEALLKMAQGGDAARLDGHAAQLAEVLRLLQRDKDRDVAVAAGGNEAEWLEHRLELERQLEAGLEANVYSAR